MDALLASLREISVLILPSLGALALIFLLVIFKKVYDLMKRLNLLLDRVDKTMDVVDKELSELQVSLQVINGLAKGILTVQSFTKHSLTTLAIFLADHVGSIKEWLKSVFEPKHKHEEETIHVDDEDTEIESI
jgi:uncharacterized protein YoxC